MNNNHKEIKYIIYVGIICLVSLSLFFLQKTFQSAKETNSTEHTIEVSGFGEFVAVPDVATFSFAFEETAEKGEDAQQALSLRVKTFLEKSKELGIDEKNIKTESYTISPKYEWLTRPQTPIIAIDGTPHLPDPTERKQVQVGFIVRQGIKIKLYDFEKIPSLLTLLTSEKVNNLYGPSFEVDDMETVQAEARKEAIINAKKKAQVLARMLGVKLDTIVSFYENNNNYPVYREAMLQSKALDMDGGMVEPSLPTGENTISSQVTIGYSIR